MAITKKVKKPVKVVKKKAVSKRDHGNNVEVERTKTGILKLKLTGKYNFESVIDELWWKDMEVIHSQQDGWMYVFDANNNTVYWLTDHHYDAFKELATKGSVSLPPHKNDLNDYADYEWNKERINAWKKDI